MGDHVGVTLAADFTVAISARRNTLAPYTASTACSYAHSLP